LAGLSAPLLRPKPPLFFSYQIPHFYVSQHHSVDFASYPVALQAPLAPQSTLYSELWFVEIGALFVEI
jgi:hypothetical protein